MKEDNEPINDLIVQDIQKAMVTMASAAVSVCFIKECERMIMGAKLVAKLNRVTERSKGNRSDDVSMSVASFRMIMTGQLEEIVKFLKENDPVYRE